MFCSKCGNQLAEGASFCPQCGTPAPNAQAQGSNATPIMSVPAQNASSTATASSVATQTSALPSPNKKTLAIGAASAGVVLVAAAVVCLLFFTPLGGLVGGNAEDTGHKGALSTVTIGGTTIESLARPVIATTVQGSSGMSAAPALISYRTVAAGGTTGSSAATGLTSPSQSTGNSKNNTGNKSTDGTADNSKSDTPNTTEDGGVTIQNSYGNLAPLTPAADLSNVSNVSDFSSYLTNNNALTNALATNQFAVDLNPGGTYSEFFDVYEFNRYQKLASFVTTDSMMHSYHLYFSYLLKNVEKNNLSSDLNTLSKAMLQASIDQQGKLAGTEWEEAAQRNVVFFSVGCRLLDPATQIPSSVEGTVNAELAKINAAGGIEDCSLTGEQEDYSQYKPRGYYEGDAALESYFRAMMWYGRMNFTQKDDSLDRSALLITLALDGGNNGTVNSDWEAMYSVTSFFAGAADDQTYYEYYPLFEYAYGKGATVDSLAGNGSAWGTYHELTKKMPAPKIDSLATGNEATTTDDDSKGLRFMGQRFSIDEATFQQLVYDNVGDSTKARTLPAALDLPAALGSDDALDILKEEGKTDYANYDTQMENVRTELANSDDSLWTASLYSQWLYTLNPLLAEKGEGYPSFMQSSEWNKKNLQSYLGSYTELKHDTVLYSKQVVAEMGGSIPVHDDRGYVEPEPELYERLANLTQATSDGLARYNMLSQEDADNLALLKDLATQLQTISQKELAGESLSTDEYELIRSYGGQIEHFWKEVNDGKVGTGAARSREFPAAVVVDIATDGSAGTVLEEATGPVSFLYVLVPIDGELHLCRGATFSHYEFEQPMANRLTDSSWREMMGISGGTQKSTNAPQQPAWTNSFTIADKQ